MTGFSNVGRATGFAGVDGSGNPSGDLTGSYPNPLVKGLWDNPIDPRIPANGDTLVYNGGEWIPTPSPSNTAALFKGVWDATANTPDIANYPGLSDGFTWLVQFAGNTNLDGITGWLVGDYAIYSGGNWYKLSNSSFGWGLTGNAGTIPTVNYVGTSDAHDFSLRANAIEGFKILYTGGTQATGDMRIIGSLLVDNNLTGTNGKFTGNIAVDGGDLTTSAGTFNLLNTVTTIINFAGNADTLNVGKITGTNTFQGANKFPQGLSGSHTKLTDGTSAFVGDTGVLVMSASNGAVTFKVDDSKFASLTGSTFTGVANFNTGLSGSLTKLVDGTSYIVAGNNITVVTQSNGSILVTAIPSGSSTQVQFNDGGSTFGATAGLTFDKSTSLLTVAGNVGVNGGSVTTTSTTGNVFNAAATSVNIGGGATVGVNVGNSAGTNVVSGTTKLPQGLSGSLTKLSDGSSYLIAGGNIAVTSASNGPVTVAFNTMTVPMMDDVLIYDGTTWKPSSIINTLQTSYQTVRAQGNILAGDVCYIVNAGGSNAYPTVAKAQANSLSTCKGVIGLATKDIAANTTGSVQTYGQLPGPVTTNTFAQGAPLFVSPTVAGGVTDVKPSGPNVAFQVGFVTRQGQPNNVTTGIVFVSPMQETNTQNINDLVLTTPAEHEVMTYEAATAQWKNKQTLWVPNTQVAFSVAAAPSPNNIITAAAFANVVYLPINTQGGANVTLNASTPIASLTKTVADYGRELWLHNLDNNRSISIPSGGNVKLETAALVGGNLVLAPNAFVKFVWTGIGGNGAWVQTSKALIVA